MYIQYNIMNHLKRVHDMNIIKLANNLEKTEQNKLEVTIESLLTFFNLDKDKEYNDHTEITSYFFFSKVHRHTKLYHRILFLNDIPFAVCQQSYEWESIKFFNKEIYDIVKEYLKSLEIIEDYMLPSFIDENEDVGYGISAECSMFEYLHGELLYKFGEYTIPCTFVRNIDDSNIVVYNSLSEIDINIKDVLIPYKFVNGMLS